MTSFNQTCHLFIGDMSFYLWLLLLPVSSGVLPFCYNVSRCEILCIYFGWYILCICGFKSFARYENSQLLSPQILLL